MEVSAVRLTTSTTWYNSSLEATRVEWALPRMKIPPGTEVVVTGASRGIGLGIARVFAQQGASTVLVGRDATTLARSRDGLPTPHRDTAGQCHRVWAMSVARAEDWRGLFASLTRPGVLINAAGESLINHSTTSRSFSPALRRLIFSSLSLSL